MTLSTLTPFASDLLLLPLQLAAIILSTALCGVLARRLRQPRVVGEIAGGLLLGPIALGHLAPAVYAYLFPAAHLHLLNLISTLGLVLFLFLTGAELDFASIRANRGRTLAITAGNIGLPFALGVAFALPIRHHFGLDTVSPAGFFLFTGIAFSITALPVLARILEERRNTPRAVDSGLANTVLVCAAANDLIAWSLLALALALIHSHQRGHSLAVTCGHLALLLAYIAFLLQVLRPLLRKLLLFSPRKPPVWIWLPCAVAFAFLSASITDLLGVHAFFGAFLAGVCVPLHGKTQPPSAMAHITQLDQAVERTLQPVIRFALPIFFAMTGLRMQAGTLPHQNILWFLLVVCIAVFGKVVGAALPARASGTSWSLSMQAGILMNTRGLVELIALNIGLREGILTPQLFSIFVLMAILTTATTVPLLDLAALASTKSRA